MEHDVAAEWASALGRWGIPEHILDAAPQSPWIHPTESFRPTGDLFVDTPSRHRALEALARAGRAPTVLDVGCGGGRAAFGLTPPAVAVVGVDHQADMLAVFADEAHSRGLEVRTLLGAWPTVAAQVPVCDVVVCHHVLYNVADLVPFVRALTAHAAHRVVVEIPERHPLSGLSTAWKRFWDLERPDTPTADDALAVIESTGVQATLESFTVADHKGEVTDLDVEHTRIRLCLSADRDPEVREFLEQRPSTPRRLTTIWWDVTTA